MKNLNTAFFLLLGLGLTHAAAPEFGAGQRDAMIAALSGVREDMQAFIPIGPLLTCSDADGDSVRIKIEEGTGGKFMQVDFFGQVSLKQPIDAESEVVEQEDNKIKIAIVCEETNKANPQKDTIEAFLSVIDINDNAPIFTKSVDTAYYKVISENTTPGTLIYNAITVTDRDGSDNNIIEADCLEECDTFSVTSEKIGNGVYRFNIRTLQSVRGKKTAYTMVISAHDNPRYPGFGSSLNSSETHKVVVAIQDIQDLPPAFTFLPLSFNMPEDQPLNVNLKKKIGAFDQDKGDPNDIELSLFAHPDDPDTFNNNYFILGPTEVTKVGRDNVTVAPLILTKPVDREAILNDAKILRLRVKAQEVIPAHLVNDPDRKHNPMSAVEDIRITVGDVNDEIPTFNEPLYQIEFPEIVTAADRNRWHQISNNVRIIVTDQDGQANNNFEVAIVSGNGDNMFRLDKYSGSGRTEFRVSAKGEILDYEVLSNRYRSLVLKATDVGKPEYTSTAEVQISLVDVNDHFPKFDRPSYIFSINEGDYRINKIQVGQVKATDEDSGTLGEIVSYRFGNPQSMFTIDDNGIIMAVGDIDYDLGIPSYAMTVIASDGGVGSNQRELGVAVQIFIENVPDRGPRIQDSYVTYVTEAETDLRPAIRVLAEDLEGIGDIRYSIHSTVPSLPGYFQIPDPTRGNLILTRKIDFKQTIVFGAQQNTSGVVTVKVQACISGGNTQLCATTNVLVYVTDLNNYAPVFTPSAVYRVNLSELANPGDEVVQVFTTDADAQTDPNGRNAKVRYKIGGGSREHFRIEEDSGKIIVSTPNRLDVDVLEVYELLVIAQDYGNPTKSSSATVIITLLDDNNKPPFFLESTYFLSVKDDAQLGTAIGQVSAQDPDTAAKIEYSIDYTKLYVEVKGERRTSQESVLPAKEAITIDKLTGMVRTRTLLDRNLYEVINFGVIAEDVNIDKAKQPIQTATASVIVTVLGSDDVRPYYIAPGWTRNNPDIKMTRPETNEIGWTLYSLTAFDPKTSEQISRFEEIDGTDPNGFFKIEGRIVYVTQALNYDNEPNKPPPQRELSVGVRAWANDNQRYVDANIILTVKDVNDNQPAFTETEYVFFVDENAKFTTSVGSVYANDVDSGSFGDIRYSLEGPNSNHFIVVTNEESQEATIYVNKDVTIDYETFSQYTLYITATDNPETPGESRPSNEQQRSTSAVFINVIDKNDNNPIFTQDVYEFSVIGTKPIGDLVDRVKATDADQGENGDILYTISPLTDRNASFYFDVETRLEGSVRPEKIGRVIVRNSLRALPDESVFTLQITASDNGPEEVRRGSCRVIIKVSKGVIDPKPRWTPGLKSKVYVPEEQYPYDVADITATSANVSSAVVYSFITRGDTEGDYTSFHLDPQTGHVKLAEKLDYETKDSYNLRIQATDVSNNTLTNSFLLTVLVTDINDNDPAFNACRDVEYPIPVPVSVREDEAPNTYVYTAVACDMDSDQNNRMQYSWYYDVVSGDDTVYCKQAEMSSFKINTITGEIRTNKWLDREIKSQHLLCVSVSPLARRKRSMEGDLQARKNHDKVLYILVTVLDANDEGPKFVKDPITRVILEYPLSYVVDKAQAIDKDLDPNNLIRYTIDDIIYTKGSKSYQAPQAFNINARDGTISIGTYDYTDYVGGHFTITVQAADVRGEFNETDTMTVKIYVGHSSQQIRVVFEQPADITVEKKANDMIGELNGLGETGVYYEIMSIGPHIVSNAEDPIFSKTDVCLVIVKDNVVMMSLDSVKRLSNELTARTVLAKYGAVEPGPCEPAQSVYPVGWESYWWVLVAFAIFIFVITLILIIIVVFLYRGYRNYMDSHRTYLVKN